MTRLRPAPVARGLRRPALRTLLGCVLPCVLLGGAWVVAARAEDAVAPAPAPAAAPPAPPPASVEVDPEGTALACLQAAERMRRSGDLAGALDLLSAGAAQGARLVPVLDTDAQPEAASRGLFVPWAQALERLAAGWPSVQRAALAARLQGETARLLGQARGGDRAALERLCEAPVLDEVGVQALLAAAALAEECGEPARARLLLARWRALATAATDARARDAAERAEVRLAAACGDLHALQALATRTDAVGEAARQRLEPRRADGNRPAAGPPATLPRALRLAWRLDLRDPAAAPAGPALPAVAGDARGLFVHDGRRVRALDLATGVERWSFPAAAGAGLPRPAYQPWDEPLRWVERSGDDVLAVVGDPGGTGSFLASGDRELDIDAGPAEVRARLVVLQAADGRLRWHTGALRESHPVLGDRAVSCTSPALVHEDGLYVLFARRRGTLTTYAACLDRHTGRPRWVQELAHGESGRRVEPKDEEQRGAPVVQSLPWGQRPVLAGDELCVVPHAGLAAGLDARTGRVRWLRALPRFGPGQADLAQERLWGGSARNQPLPWGGQWILMPMDAPALLALEQGTGRLRWQAARLPINDLCGLQDDPSLQPLVRVLGAQPATFDAVGGALRSWGASGMAAPAPDAPDLPATGRGVVVGDWHVGVDLGTRGMLRVQAWPGTGRQDGPPVRVDLPDARAGEAGAVAPCDLVRIAGTWILAENAGLRACVAEEDLEAAYPAAGEPARRSVGACLRRDLPGLLQALDGLPDEDGPVAAALARDVERMLGEEWVGVEPWADAALPARLHALARLPAPWRERILLDGARVLRGAARWPALVALLVAWIEAPPAVLEGYEVQDGDLEAGFALPVGGRLRGDLLAAALLRTLRREPGAAAALASHEQVVSEALQAVEAASPQAQREALRRAAGTRALAAARSRLLAQARAQGDACTAAWQAADLRLDHDAAPAEALARWQSLEADACLEAGDLETGRALLEDLRRHAAALVDEQGRTPAQRITAWRAQHGWAPTRGGDLREPLAFWPAADGPRIQDRLGAVSVPSLRGPGVARAADRFLVLRGLELEVWSLASGARVAALPTGDRGWLGGSLQDSAAWLPEPGVRLLRTAAGQPADLSGLLAGDWLLSWGGAPLASTADLMRRIARSEPGSPVEVVRLRSGQPEHLRFVPQARPVEEARTLLDRDSAWLDGAGRAWLPTRTGVVRVSLDPPSVEAPWSLEGPGTVWRLEVLGGQALACVRRQGDDDLLVALDLRDGRERWRASLRGRIAALEACGSALAVSLGEPGQLLLLDAADGSLRWASPLEEDPTHPFQPQAAVRAERRAWGSTAGRMHLVAGRGQGVLWTVNSTTLALGRLPLPEPAGFAPSLAAGAYVAVGAWPSHVWLLAPDPASEGFVRRGGLSPGSLLTEQPHHGGLLDANSRLRAVGDTLHVVRYAVRWPGSAERGVTVMTFGRIEDDRRGNLRFTLLDHEPPLTRATGELLLTHLVATPDGLLASGITRQPADSGLYLRSHLWVPSAEGGSEARPASPVPWPVSMQVPWRSPPARLAGALLLLTDEGARVVPVGPPGP